MKLTLIVCNNIFNFSKFEYMRQLSRNSATKKPPSDILNYDLVTFISILQMSWNDKYGGYGKHFYEYNHDYSSNYLTNEAYRQF